MLSTEKDEYGMPKLVINASLKAKAGHEAAVAAALEKVVRASREEPGVETYFGTPFFLLLS